MTTSEGFNADQRASDRANRPIVIGETVFRKLRVNNQVQRTLQRLARQQERVNRRQEQIADLIDAIDTGDETRITELEPKVTCDHGRDVDALTDLIDQVGDEATALTFQMIREQLAAVDGGEPPTLEFLQEHLDAEDVMPLVRYLSGRPADPPMATAGTTG